MSQRSSSSTRVQGRTLAEVRRLHRPRRYSFRRFPRNRQCVRPRIIVPNPARSPNPRPCPNPRRRSRRRKRNRTGVNPSTTQITGPPPSRSMIPTIFVAARTATKSKPMMAPLLVVMVSAMVPPRIRAPARAPDHGPQNLCLLARWVLICRQQQQQQRYLRRAGGMTSAAGMRDILAPADRVIQVMVIALRCRGVLLLVILRLRHRRLLALLRSGPESQEVWAMRYSNVTKCGVANEKMEIRLTSGCGSCFVMSNVWLTSAAT